MNAASSKSGVNQSVKESAKTARKKVANIEGLLDGPLSDDEI